MKLKIGIAGPSGTGKSTLAKYIAEQYKIPFITCSTKPLWDDLGIRTHRELIERSILDPRWGLQFQHDVLAYRLNALKNQEEFVTDRSPLDNLVYFLLQCAHVCSEKETGDYIKACSQAITMFNGLICLPFTSYIPLENDGMRIANKYYQILVNDVFRTSSNLMSRSLQGVKMNTIIDWDWEKRTKITNDFITTLKSK